MHFSRRESEKNPEVPLKFGKGPGRSLVNAELLGACSQSLPVSDGQTSAGLSLAWDTLVCGNPAQNYVLMYKNFPDLVPSQIL